MKADVGDWVRFNLVGCHREETGTVTQIIGHGANYTVYKVNAGWLIMDHHILEVRPQGDNSISH